MKLLLLALALIPTATFATIVTTFADEDDGTLGGGTGISLREAVNYSSTGDTITFDSILSGQTIRLIRGELTINRSLIIDGSALPIRINLSGDKTGDGKSTDDTRILSITTGAVVLDSLVLSGGNCPTGSPATLGAGIYINNSTTQLTIRNSVFSSNHAVSGGGIYFSGLVNSPSSTLEIQHSTFTGNTATYGGAIYGRESTARIEFTAFTGNTATLGGGGIWNRFNLSLTSSTLSGNFADRGGGIFQFSRNLSIEGSTLSGNSASSVGGAINLFGGTTSLRNSTLVGNSAEGSGGGIYSTASFAALVVEHTTVSNNSALTGSGITTSSGFTLTRSIVAGNIGEAPANIGGYFTGSYNIALMGASPPANPILAPLGNYGGPTQTMPPLTGSPAINAAGSSTLITDQRGFPRDVHPDIGAAESPATRDLSQFWTLDSDGDGSPYGTEQALGTNPSTPDSSNFRNLTSPTFNASGHAILKFGIAPAAPGTRWILKRSPDLSSGSFVEIYRFDGTSDITAPGVTFLRTATSATVTDSDPLPGRAFYRFESSYEP